MQQISKVKLIDPLDGKEKNYRHIFVSPPNKLLLSVDLSSQEIRIAAFMSNDPEMIRIQNSGQDAHTMTAYLMFKDVFHHNYPEFFNNPNWTFNELKPIAAAHIHPIYNKSLRDLAKIIGLGQIYAKGADGLAKDFNLAKTYVDKGFGEKLAQRKAVRDAEIIINNYFDPFPVLKSWIADKMEFAGLTYYAVNAEGRIRFVNDASVGKSDANACRRQGVNAPIQSFAAEQIKEAMIEISKEFPNSLILQVHDELIFEIPGNLTIDTNKYESVYSPESIINCSYNKKSNTYKSFVYDTEASKHIYRIKNMMEIVATALMNNVVKGASEFGCNTYWEH